MVLITTTKKKRGYQLNTLYYLFNNTKKMAKMFKYILEVMIVNRQKTTF